MIMNVYAVYDAKSGFYMRPFFMQADGVAVRAFQDEVNREAADNPLYNHSGDFSLYRVGQFDDSIGELKNDENRTVLLVTGDQIRLTADLKKVSAV